VNAAHTLSFSSSSFQNIPPTRLGGHPQLGGGSSCVRLKKPQPIYKSTNEDVSSVVVIEVGSRAEKYIWPPIIDVHLKNVRFSFF